MPNHDHKQTNGKKLGWTILLNLVITISEYVGGIFSGSLALISDAGHNFSDVLSLVLSYFGENISAKKSTEKHSFGLKRFEVFTALINALSLWAIGIYIIIEAVNRLESPEKISLGIMLPIAFIGLFGNVFSIIILKSNIEKNLNMKAAYLHLFYDAISSIAVIISAILIYFTNLVIFDIVASATIALLIFWSGFKIIKRAIHIFMQGVPENIDFEGVYKTICNIQGVKSVHDLHIWSISSEEIFLSCHVCIENDKTDNDKIIKEINSILKKYYNIYHTAIQIEEENMCNANKLCTK